MSQVKLRQGSGDWSEAEKSRRPTRRYFKRPAMRLISSTTCQNLIQSFEHRCRLECMPPSNLRTTAHMSKERGPLQRLVTKQVLRTIARMFTSDTGNSIVARRLLKQSRNMWFVTAELGASKLSGDSGFGWIFECKQRPREPQRSRIDPLCYVSKNRLAESGWVSPA